MSADAGQSFLGSGWAFPPRFRRDGALGMVSDEQDIRESLLIILSTTPGERVMHPTFGCGLRALVFESVDESLKTRIKDVIARAVTLFEPRVQVELVAVHTGALDEALLKIELGYRIRATNTAANMVFPFNLGKGQETLVGGLP
jgi:phage baseplate assembly protein W